MALLVVAGCGNKHPVTPIITPPLDSIRVSPDTLTVSVGQTAQFIAVGYDTTGTAVQGLQFRWTTTDTAGVILRVDGLGRVRGVSEGIAWVFAEGGGARDSAVVIVTVASTGWFTQVSNANGANLNGVFFLPDGRTGWAVGDAGKILSTRDAGSSWSVQVSGTSFSLSGVWFTSPLEGWAVGAGGTVLQTLNGGQRWTRVNAGASEILNDVQFANDSTGWAVGSSGVILHTSNHGKAWTRLHPTGFTLHSVSFADTLDGWAVGDGGVILGTHNGGRFWFIVQPSVTSLALKGVWRRSEPTAFAVGAQGAAPRTIHLLADTTRWELRDAGASNQLEGVNFPTDSIGYAVGFKDVGVVLKTLNGGVTWQAQVSNTQFRLNDVFFVDEVRGWAVGTGGTIIHTGTGGEP
jgi:photosystem II stability/assembly factor-like uncharacterized protein